jgi:hypothetical protein
MKQQKTVRQALSDPNLLGQALVGGSWTGWRTLLLALAGEPLQPEELAIFTKLTGRVTSPAEWVKEFWGIVGRRGGKSRAMGVLAAYLATLCKWPMLASGERGIVMILAPDQRQAAGILGYAAGALEESPILRQRIVRRTTDTLELQGNIFIEVRASNFRRIRGATLLAALLDEIAFFMPDEFSSNPDIEIIGALKPALMTTGGPLIGISSPYSRKGVLWEAYNRDYGPDGDPSIMVAQGASRDLNPSLPQAEIDREYAKDHSYASAEYGAQFRTDLESFVSPEVVDACTDPDFERPYHEGFGYMAFIDPSGGSADSMTMAIAHVEGDIAVLDIVREIVPPFNPSEVVEEFCAVMRGYRITRCLGDRYAMEWVVSAFDQCGIFYEHSEQNKSELYGSLLPMLNSGTVALLQHDRLRRQLLALERRTGRGRDIIDHPRNQHDDVANAVAGALVLAKLEPGSTPLPGWGKGETISYMESGVA